MLAGWICLGIGLLASLLSLGLLLPFVSPFFFAAFVLAIIAIVQKRVGGGVVLLISSITLPTLAVVLAFAGLLAFGTPVEGNPDDNATPPAEEQQSKPERSFNDIPDPR